ncbi:hypothetical protein WMF31_14695 [Sorangium sp. So ce1036]|uniref:hypothetical protein n=1 Tax=Sorangium sp. So ce1036 TaxID=3133328 RepID=UPI003F05CA72
MLALVSSHLVAAALVACGSSGEDTTSSGAGGTTATGTSSGTAGGGGGGECELLPEIIDTDTAVGPGCVRLDRTTVEGATLTIAPGTTVLVEPSGYLSLSGESGSTLVAKGTEDEPIAFESGADTPAPGDWQCIYLGAGASASELEYATFAHGGQPCTATGEDLEAAVIVMAPVRRIAHVTVEDSQSHGVLIGPDAGVRAFEENTFSGNGKASIHVALPQVLSLGAPNTFSDEGDFIEIDSKFALEAEGTWRKQAVPFRSSGFQIDADSEVTVEAGTRIELTGGSIDAFAATLNLAGTEEEPVVITSAQASPQAGDWGCLVYSSASEITPTIEHAVIEYGGNGEGCSGAKEPTLLWAPPSARITNSVFRHSAGTAIKTSGACDTAAWCANTFEDIATGPLECSTSNEETACP